MASRNYWGDLWRYRELMLLLAWRDVSVRYKQTLIGIAWAALRPALTMAIFVLFRRVVGVPTTDIPDAIIVLAAILPWQFFSSAVSESSSSLVGNAHLISKVYFPRMIVPCSTIATSLVDFLINLALFAIVLLYYRYAPGWQVVLLPFFLFLVASLSLGIGLLLSALNVEYRDFRFIVPFMVQFGLFICPIAFRITDVPSEWRLLFSLNPMVGIIEGFRWCLTGSPQAFDLPAILLSVLMSALACWIGASYFRSSERRFADVI